MTTHDFYIQTARMIESGQPFVVATVIRSEGSTAARAGSKALIAPDGTCLFGWVGGGCGENAIAEAALAALRAGEPSTLHVELTDAPEGVGLPCGGWMEVYLEPVLPSARLVLAGHGRIIESLALLGSALGFHVTVADPLASRDAFPTADAVIDDGDPSSLPVSGASAVVVGTHHKGDHFFIRRALESGAWYVALISSARRAEIVRRDLEAIGAGAEAIARMRSPAGLDLGAQEPAEIALSILAEIVALRRGGSGAPLSGGC